MIVCQCTSRGITSQLCVRLKELRTQGRQDMARHSSGRTSTQTRTLARLSAESGVPTFREVSFWRKWQAQDLATPGAFSQNPSKEWEFYHYRTSPTIAECEARLQRQGRRVTVITQNIDELHYRARSTNVLEIHGSLFKTSCMNCGNVAVSHKSPICAALEGKGAAESNTSDAQIPPHHLPRWCKQGGCSGPLRPDVELDRCDLCLVVRVSVCLSVCLPPGRAAAPVSTVLPAAMES
uniref:Sirtuin 5 n=1 Tax=Oncorhynchus mykiss TaxID=8022 RepID=A0A8C7T3M6_ONCMY